MNIEKKVIDEVSLQLTLSINEEDYKGRVDNALRSYVTKISRKGDEIRIRMYNKAKLNPKGIPDLIEKHYPVITFSANPKNPEFVYNIKADKVSSDTDMCDSILSFLEDLQRIREE